MDNMTSAEDRYERAVRQAMADVTAAQLRLQRAQQDLADARHVDG